MNTSTIIGLVIVIPALFVVATYLKLGGPTHGPATDTSTIPNITASTALQTDTTRHSIPLDQILDGGPGRDGILALINPKFTSIANADRSITDDVDGILVTVGPVAKFYPYNSIVWHEIVNDVVNGKPLVVTFCPLCGSAIVFDAQVNGKAEQFGVSGKLYNSNLLMYDKTTESLWSQIEGTAVVGDLTGTKLALYPSQVISFKTLRARYPNAEVLSTETGHGRNYSLYPYGNYNNSNDLYFPISITDTRLPTKEIMYVVNFNNHSVAFKVSDLKLGVIARVDVAGKELIAELKDGEITASPEGGAPLPSYHTMWFAWAIYHQKDGIVWTVGKQL